MRGRRIGVFVVALVVGLLHAFYVRNIFVTSPVAAYFLVATILFIVGAFVALTSGTLGKLADAGLLALSLIDCGLIFATRTFPTPFFGGRILSWSMSWIPPGVVQVFVAQVVLIILTIYVLSSK